MNKTYYKLPSGKYTDDVDKCGRIYDKLADPICALFPEESKYGYGFGNGGITMGTFYLTGSQAIKIYELITGLKYEEEK